MKKILVVTMVLCSVLAVTGCGKDKLSKTDAAMKEYATTFYNLHVKGSGEMTEMNISVGQLKDAAARIGDDFDMSKLSSCTDDSYVTLKLNSTNDVESVEYHMNCSK